MTKGHIFRPLLLAAAIAVSVAGCGGSPRLNASTPEAFASGLQRYVSVGGGNAPKAQRKQWVDSVVKLYVKDGKFRDKLLPQLPPRDVFERIRFDDLDSLLPKVVALSIPPEAKKSKQDSQRLPTEEEDVTTRVWRNKFVLAQLQDELAILNARRDVARYEDLFTIDQLEFLDASYIPPQPGMPIGKDVASFALKFHNKTGFNLYKPAFHVVVSEPDDPVAIVDSILTYSAASKENPIAPGEVETVILTCCNSFLDPVTNARLRELSPRAKVDINLVAISDYANKNLIADSVYTAEDNQRLTAVKQCITEIQADPLKWSQQTMSEACEKK